MRRRKEKRVFKLSHGRVKNRFSRPTPPAQFFWKFCPRARGSEFYYRQQSWRVAGLKFEI